LGRDEEHMQYGGPDDGPGKAPPAPPPEQPSFGLSGKLAAETNKVNGVELKHQPPPDAAKPDKKWRLYVFKDGSLQDEPFYLHRLDHYLFGRDINIADVMCAHPSISKQHAVLQFRRTDKPDEFGLPKSAVRPYLIDLGTVNGTFLNGERIEALRFYELLVKDTIKFGMSTREYVLLHEDVAD